MIQYTHKIRPHLVVTIVPIAPFSPKSASNLYIFFLTYIYLSKHKFNKTYKVPHKTTQDEKKNRTNRN